MNKWLKFRNKHVAAIKVSVDFCWSALTFNILNVSKRGTVSEATRKTEKSINAIFFALSPLIAAIVMLYITGSLPVLLCTTVIGNIIIADTDITEETSDYIEISNIHKKIITTLEGSSPPVLHADSEAEPVIHQYLEVPEEISISDDVAALATDSTSDNSENNSWSSSCVIN